MLTEKIIEDILMGNMSDAVAQTEYMLYEKVNDRIKEMKVLTASVVYNNDDGEYDVEIIDEGDKDGPEYKKFFRLALKKFGASTPDDLSDDQKKKFFDYVDKNWKSDAEEATGKDDPDEDDEKAVARFKKKKKNGNGDENGDDEEEVEENISLAPAGKGRKAAKALYQDTTTEEYE
tara:strand:+ start:36 stop:563 length:528 start_codon:yes stop_codon:yes gene_type:complete